MSMDPTQGAQIPDELIALYSAAEIVLLTAMVEAIIAGIDTPEWEAQQTGAMLAFRDQARTIAAELGQKMPGMVADAVDEAGRMGREAADEALAGIPDRPIPPGTPPRPDTPESQRTKQQATQVLAEMTQRLPGAAGELYGKVTTQVTARYNPNTGTRLDAAQQALDILTRRGITGFKDSAGRNWSLSSYLEMKSRTIVTQELIDSHTDRMTERGHVLLVVSSHSNPSPQCQPFEGQILSLDGQSGTRIMPSAVTDNAVKVRVKATLREARARGFEHPNCRHAVSAYVAGASRTFSTRPQAAGYEATQDQRRMERRIRELKRQQITAVTPERKRQVNRQLKAHQAQLKTHIAEWDLKRRPKRERPTGAR